MVIIGVFNELDAIANDVLTLVPDAVIKYEIPKEPKSNLFVIRTQNNGFEKETALTYKIDRAIQVIYYTKDVQTAIDVMESYGRRCLAGNGLLAVNDDSLRYLRIEGFGYSQPLRTENEIYSVVGVLECEVRQARNIETYQKIRSIRATINS